MSFFAVAHTEEKPSSFEVLRCHANLFVLKRWWGIPDFWWDVGLLLKPSSDGQNSPTTIELALPFETNDAAFSDLRSCVLDQSTAAQIFGENVMVQGAEVTVPSYGEPFIAANVTPDHAVRIAKSCDKDHSLWRITFSLSGTRRTYIRVRFKMLGTGKLWQWKPNYFVREGALFELRMADVRGAATEQWECLHHRLAPIPYLNAFVVAPVDFGLVAAHPPIKYVRLIESVRWEKYIGRKLRQRLAVYHWKREGQIDADNPFGRRSFITVNISYS